MDKIISFGPKNTQLNEKEKKFKDRLTTLCDEYDRLMYIIDDVFKTKSNTKFDKTSDENMEDLCVCEKLTNDINMFLYSDYNKESEEKKDE